MKILIWLLSILLAAVLYLFENNTGTLTLLVGAVVVPIFGMLGLIGRFPAAEIQLETAREKGSTARGTLTVSNPGLLPRPRLAIGVVCRNLRTGEETRADQVVSLLPRQEKRLEFCFDCPHCGVHRVYVEKVRLCDLFGLFSRKVDCAAAAEAVILPQLFETAIYLESTDMAMPESDVYSSVKPGNDPGETFSLREYVPGDAIRKIHWKLSEKTGKTMVREFGLPVVNEVAMLLETAGARSPREQDAITEVFASVSSALLDKDIPHHIFWRDGDDLREFQVTDGDAFGFMLTHLLALPPKADGSVAQRFTQDFPHCAYSHVIVVGGQIPKNVRDLYNGNRVSILIPRRDTVAEGLQSDGTHVLSFGTDSYAMDLCRMEV